MATLLKHSFTPKFVIDYRRRDIPLGEQLDTEQKEIESKGLGIIRFHVGDGFAQYIVKSLAPLKLQHVNAGDAWQVDYVTIRGLRRADVEARMERNKTVAAACRRAY